MRDLYGEAFYCDQLADDVESIAGGGLRVRDVTTARALKSPATAEFPALAVAARFLLTKVRKTKGLHKDELGVVVELLRGLLPEAAVAFEVAYGRLLDRPASQPMRDVSEVLSRLADAVPAASVPLFTRMAATAEVARTERRAAEMLAVSEGKRFHQVLQSRAEERADLAAGVSTLLDEAGPVRPSEGVPVLAKLSTYLTPTAERERSLAVSLSGRLDVRVAARNALASSLAADGVHLRPGEPFRRAA